LCVALARKHGAPVRWNETRSENHLATIQGRGQIQHIELAADADGKLTAVRVRLLADMGAYLQLVTPGIPLLGAFLYAGVYDLPLAYDFSCTSVFTTLTPTDAYRGAGRPEATYAIERAMDALADTMGIDPMELRRRNFIRKEQFPYTAMTGLVYDSGDHDAAATKAAELADYDGVRARQATQNVPGAKKVIGIGQASYFE
ncbi:MAG: molybdopterin-dependent oxidoreductase, partial [Ottowia sp.]|nr:molybdopterin-dependent oxidoreductase [Ottowia sp.]